MPTILKCERCGKTLKVKDELAGKTGRCPSCGAVIEVPTAVGTLRAEGILPPRGHKRCPGCGKLLRADDAVRTDCGYGATTEGRPAQAAGRGSRQVPAHRDSEPSERKAWLVAGGVMFVLPAIAVMMPCLPGGVKDVEWPGTVLALLWLPLGVGSAIGSKWAASGARKIAVATAVTMLAYCGFVALLVEKRLAPAYVRGAILFGA